MKVAIMQPYFLPYIGYFQLMSSVDKFVIYDNIEFTKKGWINRNRILVNGADSFITLPLKKASDFLDVRERFLADFWPDERKKCLNRIREAYRRAPYFDLTMPLVEGIFNSEEKNLFDFIFQSVQKLKNHLGVETELVISSQVEINHELKASEKVISICKKLGADNYINSIGGLELYNKDEFEVHQLKLQFIKSNPISYQQFGNEFVPWLSIIDVLMFVNPEIVEKSIKGGYEFI